MTPIMFTEQCDRSIFEYFYTRLQKAMSNGIVRIAYVIGCLDGIECLRFVTTYYIRKLLVVSNDYGIHGT